MHGSWLKKSLKRNFSAESIRVRLLLIMVSLMVASLGILSTVSYYFSDRALTKSINSNAAAIGNDYSHRVTAFVGELVLYVEMVAINPDLVRPQDRQQIVSTLAAALAKNPKFTGINYGDMEGNMIRAQGDTAYLGDRPYYQEAVKTGKMTVSAPLLSRGSGKMSLAIAVPVIRDGQVTAIIQATMPLASLNQMVQETKFMETGYAFIVDQSGILIAHGQQPDLNGKLNLLDVGKDVVVPEELPELNDNFRKLFSRTLAEQEQHQGCYGMKKASVCTVFTPIHLPGGAQWLVGISAPQSEVASDSRELNQVLVKTAAVCLLLGVLVIVLISRRFARPEEKYFKAFRYVADAIGIVNIESGIFVEVNEAFFKIFGYSREEVIGFGSDSFGLWEIEVKAAVYEELNRQKSLHNKEVLWRTKNGQLRPGIFSADVMMIGRVAHAVFIWHDITAEKEAEAALQRANEQLEQKVEERTQELYAANQELTAMNQEMIAVNEELGRMNRALEDENIIRSQTQDRLLRRDRQYRATTNLLVSNSDVNELMKTVLGNAVELVEATGGFIGLYDKDGQEFVLHDGIGVSPNLFGSGLVCQDGPLHKVYESGEIYQAADVWWESVLEPEAEEPVLTSMLLVPLKQGRQVKGVLAAAWKPAGKVIVQEDAEILRQFSDLAFFAMDRLQAQVKIQHMAYYDVLTELPNRAQLNQKIGQELERARSGKSAGILLFIDIDDFKAVNDTFGHSAGDKVIVDAASSLQQAFTESAEVFRISGDEFIVLAPGRKTKEQAAALAEVACKALSREYNVAGETIHLSASIGVVCYPQQADWPEELLKMADAAMYAAKAAGRNCWRFFEPVLLQKTADDMMMLNALRRALVKNEFFLVYQPQFTTDGRRIAGFEALLRWNSEEYGLVPPSSFIPLAERSSLILEIGQWVLQESCRFAAQLAENAWGDVHIAANISTRQMRSEDFVSLVKENVEKFSLRPAQLELEITESILMENMTEGIATLRELHAYGCRLALDDFGTGFSSLTYLRNLPVDCLKIDKSFIDTIALDTLQKKMVCSIIGLGHTLGMEVVAEGAEDPQQVECLLECSCDYVQGYVFSRPVAQAEAIKLLQKTRWSSADKRE